MLLLSSDAYDTYWRFAAERQEIYYARLLSLSPPWTADRVLAKFRFTNAYRAADRVSQFLIRHVIYSEAVSLTPEDVAFRVVLFRFFNKIETWRLLEARLGPVLWRNFDIDAYAKVLDQAMQAGEAIYSAAYIVPPPSGFGYKRKHRNHLALLDAMMRDSFCRKLGRAADMEEAFEVLSGYPTIGIFLAYQLAIDINYSELTDFTENEFVAAGPGAVDGIRKIFHGTSDISDADVIRMMVDRQDVEFSRLGLAFRDLFGRPLQLIDCQNIFCEVGKYSRVVHPQYTGKSRRTRIKQVFAASGRSSLPRPWFPPKWQINARVSARLGAGGELGWN